MNSPPPSPSECELDDSYLVLDSHFSDAERDSITAVTVLSSLLSVFGSGFILLTYHLVYGHSAEKWLHPDAARARGAQPPPSTHLLYWLSFSDFLLSFTYVVDGITPSAEHDARNCGDGFCVFLGASQQFFGLTSILWTAGLAYNIQVTVLSPSLSVNTERTQKMLPIMHALFWGISGLVVVILAGLGSFGSAGQWCWIRTEHNTARLLVLYVPLFFVLAFHAISYWRVRQRLLWLRRAAGEPGGPRTSDGTVGVLSQLGRRFRNYAIVFALVWVVQIINRFQNIAAPDEPSYVLYMLQSLLGPLQGLGNAVVYGITPRVRSQYARLFPRCCGWMEPAAPSAEARVGSCAECCPAPTAARQAGSQSGIRELGNVSVGAL